MMPTPKDLFECGTAACTELGDHPSHPPSAAHVGNTASHHCCNLLLRNELEFSVVFSKDARQCLHHSQNLVFEGFWGCVCAYRHNVHTKARVLPQQLHTIRLMTIKSIFSNHLSCVVTLCTARVSTGLSSTSPPLTAQPNLLS